MAFVIFNSTSPQPKHNDRFLDPINDDKELAGMSLEQLIEFGKSKTLENIGQKEKYNKIFISTEVWRDKRFL